VFVSALDTDPDLIGSEGIRIRHQEGQKVPIKNLAMDPEHWLKRMYLLTEEPQFAGDVKKSTEANPEYCDVCDLKYSSLSEFAMNSGMG
jgi:hypothetical protein